MPESLEILKFRAALETLEIWTNFIFKNGFKNSSYLKCSNEWIESIKMFNDYLPW